MAAANSSGLETSTVLSPATYWTNSLGMVFQLRNDSSSERWGGESEDESSTEFFVGLKMSVGFGE